MYQPISIRHLCIEDVDGKIDYRIQLFLTALFNGGAYYVGALLSFTLKVPFTRSSIIRIPNWGTDQDDVSDLESAVNIGPSRIAGDDCDHYAYRQQAVDWQIWIERGKTPLPRKLVITTMTEKMQPEHEMVMTWNLDVQVTEQTFAFVPPNGAQKIEFAKAVDARATAVPAGAPRQGRSAPQKKGPTP